ncbi:MAG TPA: potassium transporter, partial [Eubacteriaceae bacterium]|nr:potassium transporter [Eubacteriaceae bacterium]
AILAAVSPAVIVPRMIQLLDTGHGQKKRIPHMILAGSSVDDVFVIVLFVSLLGMNQGSGFSLLSLLHIPLSIVLGITFGLGLGAFFYRLFQSLAINNTVKALLLLGTSFLFVGTEEAINTVVPFSALLAVLGMGMALLRLDGYHAARLTESFSKLWIGAELLLFVLVGAAVNIHLIPVAGLAALALILFGLVFRSAGVGLSLLQTNLNRGERLFCVFSYLPKATVQAAIGAVPFSLGLPAGEMILAIAVLSILFTAPVGALLMDRTYAFLLKKE